MGLTLKRRLNEPIHVVSPNGDVTTFVITKVMGNSAKVIIQAPENYSIYRAEAKCKEEDKTG